MASIPPDGLAPLHVDILWRRPGGTDRAVLLASLLAFCTSVHCASSFLSHCHRHLDICCGALTMPIIPYDMIAISREVNLILTCDS